jgi:hypothetical protein
MAPAVFGYRAAGPAPGPGRDPHTLGRTRHLSNHATMQRSWLRDFDSTGGHGYTWCAQRGRSSAGEHLLCTQGVAGSSPAVSTTQDYQGLASDTPVSHPPSRQMHRVWSDAQALFLLGRQVANCSPRTVCIYRDNLARFQRDCGIEALQDATPPVIQRYLTRLREGGVAAAVGPSALQVPASVSQLVCGERPPRGAPDARNENAGAKDATAGAGGRGGAEGLRISLIVIADFAPS